MFELRFVSFEKGKGFGAEEGKVNEPGSVKKEIGRDHHVKTIPPAMNSRPVLNEKSGVTIPRPVDHAPSTTIRREETKAHKEPDQTSEKSTVDDTQILRFKESERWLHWSIAVPFMLCWFSAAILVVIYNPRPQLPLRDVFSWIHRISAVCLVALPIFSIFKGRKEYRMHLYNIKTGWSWSLNDLRWIALMIPAAISKKFVLPEQGKFNAAEKINFISGMVGLPLFIVTGVMIWLHMWGWMAWLLHVFLAVMMTPTIFGHIFMATINPDTRTGLSGMITGYVDRQWAKHHYGSWYREHFEKDAAIDTAPRRVERPQTHRVLIHCRTCRTKLSISRTGLVQEIMSVRSLECPKCGSSFSPISFINDDQLLQWILNEFEKRGMERKPQLRGSMR